MNAASFVVNTTGVAATAAQHFIYDSATHVLWYDADGSGSQAGVELVHFTNNTVMSASDFLFI